MVKQRDPAFYGTEKPIKILLKIAPPVMAALLIQALYNVVDSLFIGKYDPAGNGLNALSVIYTMQLIIICLLYTSPSPRDQRGSRMPSSA